MAENKPQVLLAQLGDEMQTGVFEDLYAALRAKIETNYDLVKKTTVPTLINHLFQPQPQPQAVLVIDGGLSKQKFKKVQIKLSEYAKAGGAVIMCCLFSSFVSQPDFTTLMQNMDLDWDWGDYHRSNFALNPSLASIFGHSAFKSLQKSYSMKAIHLKDVPAEAKVYLPTAESRTQSMVFPATKVDTAQCPAVWQTHGDGYVGFIGDVNNEVGSQALLMALLGEYVQRNICLSVLKIARNCYER